MITSGIKLVASTAKTAIATAVALKVAEVSTKTVNKVWKKATDTTGIGS